MTAPTRKGTGGHGRVPQLLDIQAVADRLGVQVRQAVLDGRGGPWSVRRCPARGPLRPMTATHRTSSDEMRGNRPQTRLTGSKRSKNPGEHRDRSGCRVA